MAWRLAELAERVGGEVRGTPELEIEAIRALERAGERDLSFFTQPAYRDDARRSRAGALLVPPELAEDFGRPLLVAAEPQLALARLIALFHPETRPAPGIHPTAVVDGAAIDPAAYVGPYVVVGAGSTIAAGAVLHAHVVLGRGCQVGPEAVLHPHVVLYDRTRVGARAILHAGVVLGADGFGYASVAGVHHKVPQVGCTVIGEDVEIGALSAIDRAVLEETLVGDGSKIDNLVQVGHNVEIGRGCILCGQVGIAGSARLGDYVVMGGQSGASGHLAIGRGAQVAGKSAVFQTIPAGTKVGGIPAVELGRWRRQSALAQKLEELWRRVRALEKRGRLPSEEEI